MNHIEFIRGICAIAYAFSIFLYCSRLLKLKYTKSVLYIFVTVISALLVYSAQQRFPIPLLYLGIYFSLYIFLHIFYEGTAAIHVFAAGNFTFHLLCIKGVLISLCAIFVKTSMFQVVYDKTTDSIISTLLFLFAIVFLYIFQKIYPDHKILKIISDASIVKALLSIQMALNITLIFTSLSYYLNENIIWLNIYHLLISVMMLIGFYIIFQFFIKDKEMKQREANITMLEQQINYEIKRYHSQSKYISMLRQIKHDFKGQLNGLRYILKHENNDSALKYIEDINNEFAETEFYQKFSDHTLLDSLFQEYFQKCQAQHIKFDATVTLIGVRISDLHVCTLFSNILNNALEACDKVKQKDERFIKITSYKSGYWQVVVIQNRYSGFLEGDKKLKTTKDNESDHGFGLLRIEEIMQENEGIFHYEAENDQKIFSVQLMFPLL